MASPFTSQHTRTVPLPWDDQNSATIRKLPGRHLERARQEHSFRSIELVKRMGGPRIQRELREAFNSDQTTDPKAKPESDPLDEYDKRVLLYKGIVSWTYPEPLTPVSPSGLADIEAAVKAGDLATAVRLALEWARNGDAERIPAIDDLDEDAETYWAREILRLSKPSLFQSEAEVEAAEKNG